MRHLDDDGPDLLPHLALVLLLDRGRVDEESSLVRGRHHLAHSVAEDRVRDAVVADLAVHRQLELDPREHDVAVHAEPQRRVDAGAAVDHLQEEGEEVP